MQKGPRMLPAKGLPDKGRYYIIEPATGPKQEYRWSADGRTWYAKQKDSSWRKCPPNISIMLTKQVMKMEEEREKEALAARLYDERQTYKTQEEKDRASNLSPSLHQASPNVPEQPSASASEVGNSSSSTDEP